MLRSTVTFLSTILIDIVINSSHLKHGTFYMFEKKSVDEHKPKRKKGLRLP